MDSKDLKIAQLETANAQLVQALQAKNQTITALAGIIQELLKMLRNLFQKLQGLLGANQKATAAITQQNEQMNELTNKYKILQRNFLEL